MKKIMVRADDLGFSKAVNYGIYETVKNGVIKNIGFMVNMPDTMHGYELVKDYDICLGQHTNVCVGKPISDPSLIPSLVQENGDFKSSKTYRASKEDFVVLEEAVLEVEAQYQRFKEIVGKEPAYFEAHAVASTNLNKAIEIVGNRHNLKVLGMPTQLGEIMKVNGQPMYMHMDSMFPNYDPFASFKKMVENAQDGFNMMVCHPGYLDHYIMSVSSLTQPRTLEVDMLTGSELKEYLKENNIYLYTYDEV
jgi:chitin disaccharide deacetylase